MTATLVLDTETTGKLNYRMPPHVDGQPWIVQIGAQMYNDVTRRIVGEVNFIVDPRSVEGGTLLGNDEASKVHGITDDVITRFGVPYSVGFASFNNLLKRADRIVAHNTDFDFKMLTGAYKRMDAPANWLREIERKCTMTLATPVLKIPGKYGDFKWPSLMETYMHFVDPEGFDGAHDAMADVRACGAIYWKMIDEGITTH